MKRNISVGLLCFILLLTMLSSCDTTIFLDKTDFIDNTLCMESVHSPDGRYLATDGFLLDQENGELHPLVYQDPGDMFCTDHFAQEILFREETLVITAYACVTYYKVSDGSTDYNLYHPVIYTFDMEGKQIRRDENGEGILRDALPANSLDHAWSRQNSAIAGIDNFENYTISNGVYHIDPIEKYDTLNETERTILDQILEWEEISLEQERYYLIELNAYRIGERVYTSYVYCNKKGWKGQNPVRAGYRSARLFSYDESLDSFTTHLELEEESRILAFNDRYVTYCENDCIHVIDLTTGNTRKLLADIRDGEPDTYVSSVTQFGDCVLVSYYDRRNTASELYTVRYVYDIEGHLLRNNK